MIVRESSFNMTRGGGGDEDIEVSLVKGGWGCGCIKQVEFRENERAFFPQGQG